MQYKTSIDVLVILFYWTLLFTAVFGTCYFCIFEYFEFLVPLIPYDLFVLLLGIHLFRMNYEITEDELIIRALFTHRIPKESIIDATPEDGMYRMSLFGPRVFCNNLKTRVIVRTPEGAYILSPDNPDSFVISLRKH